MNGCEHTDIETVDNMVYCTDCGMILIVTGRVNADEPEPDEESGSE